MDKQPSSQLKPVSIIRQAVNDSGLWVEACCGKVSAGVWINGDSISVTCFNAAHRVWRGMGRRFDSVAEALAAYRSPQMQAIIAAADKLNA